MENPFELHMLVAKRVLQYLQGTKNYGLKYQRGLNHEF